LERDRGLGPMAVREQGQATLEERVGVVGSGVRWELLGSHALALELERRPWTKSSTAAAISAFEVIGTCRSPPGATIVTSFSSTSKPISSREMSFTTIA